MTKTEEEWGNPGGHFDMRSAMMHDFRNLLQCACSALHVTRRGLTARRERELVDTVDTALVALDRSILLALRLVGDEPAEGKRMPVDVPKLIVSMRGLIRQAVSESVQLDTVVAENLPPVCCDPYELENALLNLAINSRHAMPGGGVLIIECRECGVHGRACIVINVIDAGVGMPPEVARQACEPYFTTKSAGSGMGLGLARVRSFVEGVGGNIEVRSMERRGTCMRLHLPASTQDPAR